MNRSSSVKHEPLSSPTPSNEVSIHKRIKTEHIPSKLSTSQEQVTKKPESDDDDDDMFGDDIELDELDISAIIKAEKKQQDQTITVSDIFDELPSEELNNVLEIAETQAATKEKRKKFTRYLVANMTQETYEVNEEVYPEKVLVLIQEEANFAITARLRQEWIQTKVAVGDVVHIPYTTSKSEDIIIDNLQNLIIVHPDQLISCTSVADSHACLRKSVLQLKIKGVSEYSEALVHGNIIHIVLQSALKSGDFSIQTINDDIERVVMNSLDDLYAIDQDEQTAIVILKEYTKAIHQFGTLFVNEFPKPNACTSKDMGSDAQKEMGYDSVAISRVLDIEEHLWSPTYGLKGMVDASVQLRLSPTNKVLTVPFELKTGKPSRFLNNRAQTLLYTLLMSDRYDVDISAGILYYSKTNSLYLVPSLRNDLRSLIMSRNHLAIACKSSSLPPMIRNSHTCQYCYINDACMIYHKAIEKGNGNTSGLFKLFDDKTSHMNETTCKFFKHWWELLDQEETNIDYIRKDIWSQPGEIREMSGQCLANMVLNLPASQIDVENTVWKYCFVRGEDKKSRPLLCSMSPGDPVVVSSMDGHINLAMGFIATITATEIILSLNEPLRYPPIKEPTFDPYNNQTFRAFVERKYNPNRLALDKGLQYRIDKDEMSTGMNLLRGNLVSLTAKSEDEPGIARLRELIIDLKKPDYYPNVPPIPPTPKLNPDQRNALMRVMHAKDYSLILGMPGTGKTTTAAEIISYLVSQGKTVLVAAYTHTALDNVLIKVREHGIDVLRLGNIDKVMPSMRDCVPSSNGTITTVKDMQEFYDSKKVFGITCLGIGNVALQKRMFDYCIIDEASQITLPTCIGPLRYARSFVLVGDMYQLPPIVRNKDALDNGLDKSLFSILAEAHPEAVSYLEYQYRMCREIMDVSNILIYDGKLKCGTFKVASQTMRVPRFDHGLDVMHGQAIHKNCPGSDSCWLRQVMDPKRKFVFVNTDALETQESRPLGSFLQNEGEASLIRQATDLLLQSGVEEDRVAVMSVYRSQLRVISHMLHGRKGIETSTIDKYQGRDKDCILISLVRHNTQGNPGDLLRDWRRLNVAITRAKSKLVMFGSASTLKNSALYGYLLRSFEAKGWIYELTIGAESMHELVNGGKENDIAYKESRLPKVFRPTNAILKKKEVLKDIYQGAT